jgi:predicted transcriptional regulator
MSLQPQPRVISRLEEKTEKPGEIYKAVAQQRDLTYTTVKTIMERLADKGYLHCDSRQRAYVYTPTQSREAFVQQVSETVVRGLLTDFGGTLSAHLLEATVSQCDVPTLEHLQTLIEARRRATITSSASIHEDTAADSAEHAGGGDAS